MDNIIYLVIGLLGLGLGAKWLVQGSAGLATKWGVSAVVTGLTIVSIGTSSPEIIVTALASFRHESDLALGNVLGSNLCNTLLILGVASLLKPLKINRLLMQRDLVIMIGISLLVFAMASKGSLTILDGAILLSIFVIYMIYLLKRAKAGELITDREMGKIPKKSSTMWIEVVVGLALLVIGSHLTVDNASQLASDFGVSPFIIGLTVVAIGTSLPELATSVTAAYKEEGDIAVANIIGSNIFNLLIVLGIGAIASQNSLNVTPEALSLDFPAMIFSALLLVPIFITGRYIDRTEGALLLFFYCIYLTLTFA